MQKVQKSKNNENIKYKKQHKYKENIKDKMHTIYIKIEEMQNICQLRS